MVPLGNVWKRRQPPREGDSARSGGGVIEHGHIFPGANQEEGSDKQGRDRRRRRRSHSRKRARGRAAFPVQRGGGQCQREREREKRGRNTEEEKPLGSVPLLNGGGF